MNNQNNLPEAYITTSYGNKSPDILEQEGFPVQRRNPRDTSRATLYASISSQCSEDTIIQNSRTRNQNSIADLQSLDEVMGLKETFPEISTNQPTHINLQQQNSAITRVKYSPLTTPQAQSSSQFNFSTFPVERKDLPILSIEQEALSMQMDKEEICNTVQMPCFDGGSYHSRQSSSSKAIGSERKMRMENANSSHCSSVHSRENSENLVRNWDNNQNNIIINVYNDNMTQSNPNLQDIDNYTLFNNSTHSDQKRTQSVFCPEYTTPSTNEKRASDFNNSMRNKLQMSKNYKSQMPNCQVNLPFVTGYLTPQPGMMRPNRDVNFPRINHTQSPRQFLKINNGLKSKSPMSSNFSSMSDVSKIESTSGSQKSYNDVVEQKMDDIMKSQPRGTKAWMNEEVLVKIKERDELFQKMKENENDEEIAKEYKRVRNVVVTLTRRAKRDYKNKIKPEVEDTMRRVLRETIGYQHYIQKPPYNFIQKDQIFLPKTPNDKNLSNPDLRQINNRRFDRFPNGSKTPNVKQHLSPHYSKSKERPIRSTSTHGSNNQLNIIRQPWGPSNIEGASFSSRSNSGYTTPDVKKTTDKSFLTAEKLMDIQIKSAPQSIINSNRTSPVPFDKEKKVGRSSHGNSRLFKTKNDETQLNNRFNGLTVEKQNSEIIQDCSDIQINRMNTVEERYPRK